MRGRHLSSFLVLFFCAVSSRSAAESSPGASRGPSRLSIDFSHRSRYEGLSDSFRREETQDDQQVAQRTRLRLEVRGITRPFSFATELQDSRIHLDEGDALSSTAFVDKNDFLQYYVEVAPERPLWRNLSTRVKLGRFTLDLGKRRLFARNQMRNTTNSFEGVHWTLEEAGRWDIQLSLMQPVLRETEERDHRDPHRTVWGAFFREKDLAGLLAEAYYVGLDEDVHTSTRKHFSTFGWRLSRDRDPGRFDFELETIWQIGEERDRDHLAHFEHAEVGYAFSHAWSPRLSIQYDYASGDRDPVDDETGRFDSLFGARRFEYGPTGIYAALSRSNLNTPGVRAELTPREDLDIMCAYRSIWLAEAKDEWAGSGLQDSTGFSGTHVGQQFETRALWRLWDPITFELGYAHLFRGSFLEKVPYDSRNGDTDYVYVSLELACRILP